MAISVCINYKKYVDVMNLAFPFYKQVSISQSNITFCGSSHISKNFNGIFSTRLFPFFDEETLSNTCTTQDEVKEK